MTTTTILILILVGIGAGILGSLVGIGGGIVVVPALLAMSTLIPGMSPKMATGTSLAMLLPPIGFLAVMEYYKKGNINITVAVILCCGFLVGSYFGSRWANKVDNATLKKFFAVFLLLISLKFLFLDKPSSKKEASPDTPAAKTK